MGGGQGAGMGGGMAAGGMAMGGMGAGMGSNGTSRGMGGFGGMGGMGMGGMGGIGMGGMGMGGMGMMGGMGGADSIGAGSNSARSTGHQLLDLPGECASRAADRAQRMGPGRACPGNSCAVPISKAFAVYMKNRAQYRNSPAFFMNFADYFFSQRDPNLAIQVLSNVAELGLYDSRLPRMLGLRLAQMGALDLAVLTLEDVLRTWLTIRKRIATWPWS